MFVFCDVEINPTIPIGIVNNLFKENFKNLINGLIFTENRELIQCFWHKKHPRQLPEVHYFYSSASSFCLVVCSGSVSQKLVSAELIEPSAIALTVASSVVIVCLMR